MMVQVWHFTEVPNDATLAKVNLALDNQQMKRFQRAGGQMALRQESIRRMETPFSPLVRIGNYRYDSQRIPTRYE